MSSYSSFWRQSAVGFWVVLLAGASNALEVGASC